MKGESLLRVYKHHSACKKRLNGWSCHDYSMQQTCRKEGVLVMPLILGVGPLPACSILLRLPANIFRNLFFLEIVSVS